MKAQTVVVPSVEAGAQVVADAVTAKKSIVVVISDGSLLVYNAVTHALSVTVEKVATTFRDFSAWLKTDSGIAVYKRMQQFVTWIKEKLAQLRAYLAKKSGEWKGSRA